jgi:transposase-like protein
MRQKSGPEKQPAEDAIRDIRRATRRHFSAAEKIRIVLEGLRGEESIAELCRREGIALSAAGGRTIESRIHVSRPDGESTKCSASRAPAPRRNSCQPTPPFTTLSMYNVISYQLNCTACFALRR